MSKVFRIKLALKEMSSMSIKLPCDMDEYENIINRISKEMTGRTITITHAEPEYLTEEYEYGIAALQFGVIAEDVSEDPKYQLSVKESKIHNDLMPNIANKLTIEDVDRFLFDHPLEPAVEAMLIKHGYITKVTLKDVGTVLDDSAAGSADSPGQISIFSGAESLDLSKPNTAGNDDSFEAKISDEQLSQNKFNPFKKTSIEA